MPIIPDNFVAVDVEGIPRLRAYLNRLPPAVADAVMDAVAKALIDIMQSAQPPPKYVSRTQAYGVPFFSEKQRRWFFANLNDGSLKVPHHRTQDMRKGWKQIGAGVKSLVANEVPGVEFVVGDEHQSRHEKLVGWKTVGATVNAHMPRIEKIAVAAAGAAIKKMPA